MTSRKNIKIFDFNGVNVAKHWHVTGRGSFFSLLNFVFKNVPGVLKRISEGGGDFGVFGAPHAPTRGSRGVGKRYTSSYDHDM